MIIAQDVIDQIKAKVYSPSSSYSTKILKSKYEDKVDENQDAAEFMKNNPDKIHCTGCARASMFISAVKFKNSISIEDARWADFDYPYPGEKEESIDLGTKYLSDEFSPEQQALIESAFEGTVFGVELYRDEDFKGIEKHKEKAKIAVAFGEKVISKWKNWKLKSKRPKKDDYLLIEICKNIVKNKGVFKP